GGAGIGGMAGVGLIIVPPMNLLGGGGGCLEDILNQLRPAQAPPQSGPQPDEFAGEDDYEVFVSTVLGSTGDTWNAIFTAWGQQYVEPTLVLFRGTTQSACAGASSAGGPPSCPPDETTYR